MSEPFLGEIKMVTFNFAPRGWALCNGQILSIQQNQALFSLLGTTYGGNGATTFALPNLQGRVPIHVGNGHVQGSTGGVEAHTLTLNEMPAHAHGLNGLQADASQRAPAARLPAYASEEVYSRTQTPVNLNAQGVAAAGSGQPHSNLQPLLVVTFVIALQGIFPSRN